jgi:hypothetical protein
VLLRSRKFAREEEQGRSRIRQAPAPPTTLRKVVASNGVRTAYDSDGGMAMPLLSAVASMCGFSKIKLEQSEGAMGELSGAADIP